MILGKSCERETAAYISDDIEKNQVTKPVLLMALINADFCESTNIFTHIYIVE